MYVVKTKCLKSLTFVRLFIDQLQVYSVVYRFISAKGIQSLLQGCTLLTDRCEGETTRLRLIPISPSQHPLSSACLYRSHGIPIAVKDYGIDLEEVWLLAREAINKKFCYISSKFGNKLMGNTFLQCLGFLCILLLPTKLD